MLFNCADYYNNPQLLLAHIFGQVKGAFRGADTEKEGLVAKANVVDLKIVSSSKDNIEITSKSVSKG